MRGMPDQVTGEIRVAIAAGRWLWVVVDAGLVRASGVSDLEQEATIAATKACKRLGLENHHAVSLP